MRAYPGEPPGLQLGCAARVVRDAVEHGAHAHVGPAPRVGVGRPHGDQRCTRNSASGALAPFSCATRNLRRKAMLFDDYFVVYVTLSFDETFVK